MTDLFTALLALASPQGVVLLVIAFGGVALFTIVGLGGIGTRDLAKPFRYILGVIATGVTIFGCVGLFLLTYPAVSPGIQMIREDWAHPTPVIEPQSQATPEATSTSRDPRSVGLIASWVAYANLSLAVVLGIIVYYAFLANRIRLSKKPLGISYVRGRDGIQLKLQNNEKSYIGLHRIDISYSDRNRRRRSGELLADYPYDRRPLIEPGESETFPLISYSSQHFHIVGKLETGKAVTSETFGLDTCDIEVVVRYFSTENNQQQAIKRFRITFSFKGETDNRVNIKSV